MSKQPEPPKSRKERDTAFLKKWFPDIEFNDLEVMRIRKIAGEFIDTYHELDCDQDED